jgi:hypothetical protein
MDEKQIVGETGTKIKRRLTRNVSRERSENRSSGTMYRKAKFALRAKITASQESSWRGKHQPSTQNKQTKK